MTALERVPFCFHRFATMVTVDLRRNEKQAAYFYRVLATLATHDKEQEEGREAGDDALRFFHYGGGIRGGKTFVSLAIGCIIAKRYPGSKGVIIRRTWTDLQTNTIPQFKRVTEGTAGIRWRKSKDDYYAEFQNGSKISFMSENADRDPDMNRFKGLEANWFLLEQLEELRKETYDKCKERAGSLYLPKMPPALIFDTFNPTYNWVKAATFLHGSAPGRRRLGYAGPMESMEPDGRGEPEPIHTWIVGL
jgi:hypothetical protein